MIPLLLKNLCLATSLLALSSTGCNDHNAQNRIGSMKYCHGGLELHYHNGSVMAFPPGSFKFHTNMIVVRTQYRVYTFHRAPVSHVACWRDLK